MPIGRRRIRLLEIPLGAALTTLAPGLAALAMHSVVLFPSLAPTALMQAHAPDHRTSRPYNVVVGHAIGLLSALLFVWLFGLARAPSVFQAGVVAPARVWATVLAIVFATCFELLLDAPHPPAAATTLLVSLGSFRPTWADAGHIALGVLIVAVVGEGVRRFRLREMVRVSVAEGERQAVARTE